MYKISKKKTSHNYDAQFHFIDRREKLLTFVAQVVKNYFYRHQTQCCSQKETIKRILQNTHTCVLLLRQTKLFTQNSQATFTV